MVFGQKSSLREHAPYLSSWEGEAKWEVDRGEIENDFNAFYNVWWVYTFSGHSGNWRYELKEHFHVLVF